MMKGLANRRFPRVTLNDMVSRGRHFFIRNSLFDIRYSPYAECFGPFLWGFLRPQAPPAVMTFSLSCSLRVLRVSVVS